MIRYLILSLYIILVCQPVSAEQHLSEQQQSSENPHLNNSVKIAALEFSGVIQQNLHGAFDLMMRDLAKQSHITQDYQVYSPARGAKMLFSHRSDCLIPSSLYPPYFKGMKVIHSESFAQVRYLAFSLPDSPIITNKKQLAGKKIGVIRDSDTWNYSQRFNIPGAVYIKVSNLESLVNMLYHKRIDVVIHDHQDFLDMVKFLQFPRPHFDINVPMAVDKIVITCHDNPNNRAYLKAISPQLKHIIKTGKLSEYYQQSTIE